MPRRVLEFPWISEVPSNPQLTLPYHLYVYYNDCFKRVISVSSSFYTVFFFIFTQPIKRLTFSIRMRCWHPDSYQARPYYNPVVLNLLQLITLFYELSYKLHFQKSKNSLKINKITNFNHLMYKILQYLTLLSNYQKNSTIINQIIFWLRSTV